MTHARTRAHAGLLAAALALVVAALVPIAPHAQMKPEVALKAAIDKEVVDGDLKAAIEMYRTLAEQKADRAVAARALMRMGQCYEKLGASQTAESRKAYERVVRDFADQKDLADQARARLAASTGASSEPALRQVLSSPDLRKYAGISHDGRFIAWVVDNECYVRDMVAGSTRRVPTFGSGDGVLSAAALSPDGRQIAYSGGRPLGPYALHLVNTDGTNVRRLGTDTYGTGLAANSFGAYPLAWSPDGRQILVTSWNEGGTGEQLKEVGLVAVSVTDGSARVVAANGANGRFSPDGRWIVFKKYTPRSQWQGEGLFVVPAVGGPESPVVPGPGPLEPFWSHDGATIFFMRFRAMSLMAPDYDVWGVGVRAGQAIDAPRIVRQNIQVMIGVTDRGDYYYRMVNATNDLYSAEIDPATALLKSRPEQLTRANNNYGPAWSPDGKTLAYLANRTGGPQEVVLRVPGVAEDRTLTPENRFPMWEKPQWFPDGRSLLVHTAQNRLVTVDVGSGKFSQVPGDRRFGRNAGENLYPVFELLADGRTLIYRESTPAPPVTRFFVHALTDEPGTPRLTITDGRVGGFSVSPDARTLAFVKFVGAGDRATSAIMTVALGGGEPVEVCRLRGAAEVVWSRDGRRLFLTTRINDQEHGFAIDNGADIWTVPATGGQPQALGLGLRPKFLATHPDGRHLVFMDNDIRNEVWVLRNFLPAKK